MPQKSASATPQVQQSPSSMPKSTGTPRPVSTAPRPGSTVPRPGSAVSKLGSTMRPTSAASPNIKQEQKMHTLPVQIPGPPAMVTTSRTATATPDLHRGKKRDRDDGMLSNVTINGTSATDTHLNGTTLNGIGNGNGLSKLNAKAGSGGVRPRPSKKQRVVSYHILCTEDIWSKYIRTCKGRQGKSALPSNNLHLKVYKMPTTESSTVWSLISPPLHWCILDFIRLSCDATHDTSLPYG